MKDLLCLIRNTLDITEDSIWMKYQLKNINFYDLPKLGSTIEFSSKICNTRISVIACFQDTICLELTPGVYTEIN